ncbi:YkgJ family cysteine cluster protein [Candidatus Sumerlaeota bacterium]|nr:YkgJ family cysteine cluster protein [Candidatus Sumerlaeota bacterium]
MDKISLENFHCQQCGECCSGEGVVNVTEEEISRIADYLGVSVEEFKEKWTRAAFFKGYWLQEKPNKDCIFLEGNQCVIQPVKPEQCRSFPFSWENLDSIKTCPALKELRQEGNRKKS